MPVSVCWTAIDLYVVSGNANPARPLSMLTLYFVYALKLKDIVLNSKINIVTLGRKWKDQWQRSEIMQEGACEDSSFGQ